MIKKVPYTNNLITIGNAPVYAGKPVYTDGRIVYGWVYNGQYNIAGMQGSGGFFVGEDNLNKIHLVRENMVKIERQSGYHGEMWSYPAWATLEYNQYHECGYVHTNAGCYAFDGAVVALGSDGSALIYYDFKLHFMSFGQRRKDGSQRPLNIATIYVYGGTFVYTGKYYSKDEHDIIYVYDDAMTLLCTFDNGHVHSPDYDGDGTISITVDFPIFDAIDTVVDLDSLRSLSVLNPIYVIDGFRPNGQSGQQPVIYNLNSDNGTNDVRKMFQLATPQNCRLTAQTPDRDQDGNVYYDGDYVLHCDILEADGQSNYITKIGSEITVYENNVVFAYTDGTNLVIYDSQGSVIYSGAGWIDLYNLTDTGNIDIDGNTIYSGDYIALRPLSSSASLGGNAEATINGNDIIIYDDVSGDMIAEQNNDMVTVYEDNIEIYDSLGSISTNMQACEWSCDYTIRRDITGNGEKIISIGGTITHDDEGWHVDGGMIELRDITTDTLYADGTGGTTGGETTGSVTIYDSQGQVDWQGDGWIDVYNLNPQGVDSQGRTVFYGSYTIRRDVTGSGITRGSSGSIKIYDNNHDLVAQEVSGQVIMYSRSGQIDWQGSGWIDTTNRIPIRYAGSYVVNCTIDGMSGSDTIITRDNDIYVLNRQDIVANENGSGLIVYDNGNEVYDAPGHITVSNLEAQRTIRNYYIDATGIVEQQYPQQLILADGVTINLTNMDLTIGEHTYQNDPLGLLTTQSIVFPGGVHVSKRQKDYFIISQDNKTIFKIVEDNNNINNNSITNLLYDGIKNCFNLSFLRGKW